MLLYPPILQTDRLILRPFAITDSRRVQELAGAREIYETTLLVPHPYEDGMAEKWIASHMPEFFNGVGVTLAMVLREENLLIGAIGLSAKKLHRRAELGYWVGVPYWGRGYCTEAARALIDYGFGSMDCHKITARHLACNPASGRVMEKAGMTREGELKDEILKDGKFHTIILYGLIRKEGEER